MKKRVKIYAARRLREKQTDAERILWKDLRGRKLSGAKFRRQYVIRGFIVDFYCPKNRIAIELDGGIHFKKKDYDTERQKILESNGIKVIRFRNDEVMSNKARVLDLIKNLLG